MNQSSLPGMEGFVPKEEIDSDEARIAREKQVADALAILLSDKSDFDVNDGQVDVLDVIQDKYGDEVLADAIEIEARENNGQLTLQ